MKFISAATKHNVDTTTEITRSIKILTRNTTNNRRHMVKWVRAMIPFLATVHLFHERTCYFAVIGGADQTESTDAEMTTSRCSVIWGQCGVRLTDSAGHMTWRVSLFGRERLYANSYHVQIISDSLQNVLHSNKLSFTCSEDRRSNGCELQRARDIKIEL